MIDLFIQAGLYGVKLQPVTPAPSKRDRPLVTSDKRRAQMAAHYQANKADYAARSKKWMSEHPEQAREAWKQSERRRRAKRKASLVVAES